MKIKKLFNNPVNPNLTPAPGKSNGTYLHKDIVLDRIIHTLTPPPIWADNAEMLLAFSQTLVNYSPISININDYWNKEELYNILELDPDNKQSMEFLENDINPFKVYEGPQKAFFINSTLHLREAQSDVYMKSFYDQAIKARTSHTLRRNLYDTFEKYNIVIDEKDSLLFSNINAIFGTDNFITHREFNTKKGKAISFKYANKAAFDGKIEGSLTANKFFSEYEELGVLEYKVTSTILPDVYNTFVKPLVHPLGFNGIYNKECRVEFTDTVLSKEVWTADEVSVRSRNTSRDNPFKPPYMLLPWIKNDGTKFIDVDHTVFDPNQDIGADNLEWIYDKTSIRGINTPPQPPTAVDPHTDLVCVFPNDENIEINKLIQSANDPRNNTETNPKVVLATKNGLGLDDAIKGIDEGQGNILYQIETGYGDYEYSGYTFTKYIFENGAYTIVYECLQGDGKIRRLIEYYRYDYYDISVHLNLYGQETLQPRWMYPNIPITNIVNGKYYGAVPPHPRSKLIYGYEGSPDDGISGELIPPEDAADKETDIGGLDVGVWFPKPGQDNMLNPGQLNYDLFSRVNLSITPEYLSSMSIIMSSADRPKYTFISPNNIRVNTDDIYFELINFDVYKNGIKQIELGSFFSNGDAIPGGQFSINNKKIHFPDGLDKGDWVEVIKRPTVFTFEEQSLFENSSLAVYPYVKLGHLPLIDPTNNNAILDYDVFLYTATNPVWTKMTRDTQFTYLYSDNKISFLDNVDTGLDIQDDDKVKFVQQNRDFSTLYFKSDDDIIISAQAVADRISIYVNGIRLSNDEYYVDENNPTKLELKNYSVGSVIEVQELPLEMGVTSYNIINPDEPDFDLQNYKLGYPSKNTQVYINGLKIREEAVTSGSTLFESEYTTIYEENEWLSPGAYEWDQDLNIINTKYRFVPTYSLIGRWIETRESVLNVFNLQQKFVPMEEEFKIETIPYNRSIINTITSYDPGVPDNNKKVVNDGTSGTAQLENKYQNFTQ